MVQDRAILTIANHSAGADGHW